MKRLIFCSLIGNIAGLLLATGIWMILFGDNNNYRIFVLLGSGILFEVTFLCLLVVIFVRYILEKRRKRRAKHEILQNSPESSTNPFEVA